MRRVSLEKVKSFCLGFLIFMSLILTGSLWFDNYHGLFSVATEISLWFEKAFNLEDTTNEKNYSQIILPYRITITNGNEGKKAYYTLSDGNTEGWELVKGILDTQSAETKVNNATVAEWQELSNRKSIICEFGDAVETSIIRLSVLNNKSIKEDMIPEIEGIAITKTLTGALIYIKQDENKIYRIENKDIVEKMEAYIDKYMNAPSYAKLITLNEMGTDTFYGDKKIEPDYDTLFPVSNKQNFRLNVSRLKMETELNVGTLEKKATQIFNDYDYSKFITEDKGYIFINDEGSSIKLEEGIFEYKGKKTDSNNEGISFVSELDVALEFLKKIIQNEEFYLLSTEKGENQYTFRFGINIAGIPIVDSRNLLGEDMKTIATITTENGKVVSSKIILNKFEQESTKSYINFFGNIILDVIFTKVTDSKNIEVNNIDLVYDIGTKNNRLPMWLANYVAKEEAGHVLINAAKEKNY